MLTLIWITLFNALASSTNFINPLRVSIIPGVPLGFNELTAISCFFAACFRGGSIQMQYPRLRSHPLFAWLIGLWIITWICGAIGSIGTLASAKEVMTNMREYASAPLFIFIGYRMLGTPKSMRWMVYVLIIAGIGNATQLLLRFAKGSESIISSSDNLNAVREIEYFTSYAAAVFVLMLYSIFSGTRIVRPWLASIIAAYCCVGVCSAISRTSVVCMAFGVVTMMMFILPSGKRLKAARNVLLVSPVLVIALWLALQVAGQMTHRDFFQVAVQEIDSLNPWTKNADAKDHEVHKAWDTRIPSIICELGIFASNPLVGGGFAASTDYIAHGGTNWGAFNHNTLTGIMSNTGIFGLFAMVLTLLAPAVLGYRMVREGVDRPSVLMGAVGFIVATNMIMLCICTMAFVIRGAMLFGLFAGMMVRAREIQETTNALALYEQDSLQGIETHEEDLHGAEPDLVF